MIKKLTQFLAVSTLAFSASNLLAEDHKVDFTRDLLPVIEEHCLKCHGGKKKNGKISEKGDLNMLKPESVKEFFKPGHPLENSLYTLLISEDADEYMPPKGPRLSKEHKKLFFDWIKQGGSFEGYTPGKRASREKDILNELSKNTQSVDASFITPIQKLGAIVLPLAQESPLLQVNFKPVSAKINDEDCEKLPALKEQLVWLNLSRSKISDKGLEAVGKLKKLTRLSLDNTAVGDAGVSFLTELKNLEYLNLYNTKVSDKAVTDLGKLSNLKKLFLWQSKVSAEGVVELQSKLPNTKIHFATPVLKIAKSSPALYDSGSCCDKAHKKSKDCKHGCCVKAKKAGKVCKKCNPKNGTN